jgi:nitroimidazol reductase NimA-like FMN-containing flavoprotein (pyridoxamine 5'-phosphate oxidase superfamily)
MDSTLPITPKTKLSRYPKRGDYSEATIHGILDEGIFCHVSYVEHGSPMTIPTGYGRIGNKIYLHGSVGSHFMRALSDGREVCFSVSLIDGLVLARSAFHHSVNYRSVVVFGQGTLVTDHDERWSALKAITEQFVPNRWDSVRQPTKSEMQKTMIVSFLIDEASAKTRSGDPSDDEEDYSLPIWAGVLPLKLQALAPIPDPRLTQELPIPAHVLDYRK